jgi:hypothetical protein
LLAGVAVVVAVHWRWYGRDVRANVFAPIKANVIAPIGAERLSHIQHEGGGKDCGGEGGGDKNVGARAAEGVSDR